MKRCHFCGCPCPPEAPAKPEAERCVACGQVNPRAGHPLRHHPSRHLTLEVIEQAGGNR